MFSALPRESLVTLPDAESEPPKSKKASSRLVPTSFHVAAAEAIQPGSKV